MKNQVKTKLITELNPASWYHLEDDTAILVVIKHSDGSGESRQTTLGDIKKYVLNEILEYLESGERPVRKPERAPLHVVD